LLIMNDLRIPATISVYEQTSIHDAYIEFSNKKWKAISCSIAQALLIISALGALLISAIYLDFQSISIFDITGPYAAGALTLSLPLLYYSKTRSKSLEDKRNALIGKFIDHLDPYRDIKPEISIKKDLALAIRPPIDERKALMKTILGYLEPDKDAEERYKIEEFVLNQLFPKNKGTTWRRGILNALKEEFDDEESVVFNGLSEAEKTILGVPKEE